MDKSIKSCADSGRKLSSVEMAGAALVMFLWAVCFPLISTGLEYAPPFTFAALRATIAGAVLLVVAASMGRPPVSSWSTWGGIAAVGLTATSLGFFGMFLGGARIAPGMATVISNLQPLIAAALAWVVLRERLTRTQRSGLFLAFAGIVLIAAPSMSGTDDQILGYTFILIGAAGVAAGNVVLKWLAGRVDVIRAMAWQLIFGAIPLVTLSAITEDVTSVSWNAMFILNLATLSVVGTSAAFVLWFVLLQRASLGRLNVFTFLTPVFGLFMGISLFGEQLRAIEIAGVVLSVLGIYAVSRSSGVLAADTGVNNLTSGGDGRAE